MRYYYSQPNYGFNRPNFQGSVKWLIITNILVYILSTFNRQTMLSIFGLIPNNVVFHLWLWQIITYMFLHDNFFHILMNMFTLWMFGNNLESSWGTKEFTKYYFICGLGAAVLTIITGPKSGTISIGASGAVYGILLAYAMMYPDTRIYVYFLFPVKAKYFVIILGVLTFFASLGSTNSGIAHFAHLGGLVTGFLYLKLPAWNYGIKLKTLVRDVVRIYKIVFSNTKLVFNKIKFSTGKTRKNKSVTESDINRILDKILSQGVNSLTSEEEKVMQEYIKTKPRGNA